MKWCKETTLHCSKILVSFQYEKEIFICERMWVLEVRALACTIYGTCSAGINLNILLLLIWKPLEYTWYCASVLSWLLLVAGQENYIISWSAFTHTSQQWLHIKSVMCFSVPKSQHLALRYMGKNIVIFDFYCSARWFMKHYIHSQRVIHLTCINTASKQNP